MERNFFVIFILSLALAACAVEIPGVEDDDGGSSGSSEFESVVELPFSDMTSIEAEVELETDLAGSNAEYVIYAQDGTFLGEIDFQYFGANSLCNVLSPFTSPIEPNSLFNEAGAYGSDFGNLSAFTGEAMAPPVIFRDDTAWAYLTANPLETPQLDGDSLIHLLNEYGCAVER